LQILSPMCLSEDHRDSPVLLLELNYLIWWLCRRGCRRRSLDAGTCHPSPAGSDCPDHLVLIFHPGLPRAATNHAQLFQLRCHLLQILHLCILLGHLHDRTVHGLPDDTNRNGEDHDAKDAEEDAEYGAGSREINQTPFTH